MYTCLYVYMSFFISEPTVDRLSDDRCCGTGRLTGLKLSCLISETDSCKDGGYEMLSNFGDIHTFIIEQATNKQEKHQSCCSSKFCCLIPESEKKPHPHFNAYINLTKSTLCCFIQTVTFSLQR